MDPVSDLVLAKETLKAVQAAEKKLDQELNALDSMDIDALRKKRIEELKSQSKKIDEWRAQGHGKYDEVATQEDWFREVKNNDRVVCHFYRPTTWRCQILDKHFEKLAATHLETRFIRVNAENSPFLVERLQVVLMPTVVCTKDNYTSGMIEGFTELGGVDDFTTDTLAELLSRKGVLFYEPPAKAKVQSKSKNTVKSNKTGRAVYGTARNDSDEDNEEEEDD